MKSLLVIALFLFSSGLAHAACQNGQLTTLTSSTDFLRKEANGNILKITLGAGSQVHIINLTDKKTELMATAEFQGQPLSVLSEVDNSIAATALQCASN